jgi:hypothetical protein
LIASPIRAFTTSADLSGVKYPIESLLFRVSMTIIPLKSKEKKTVRVLFGRFLPEERYSWISGMVRLATSVIFTRLASFVR